MANAIASRTNQHIILCTPNGITLVRTNENSRMTTPQQKGMALRCERIRGENRVEVKRNRHTTDVETMRMPRPCMLEYYTRLPWGG